MGNYSRGYAVLSESSLHRAERVRLVLFLIDEKVSAAADRAVIHARQKV